MLLWETVWQFLRRVNTELPCDPSIPILHIYSREIKICSHKNWYTNIHSSIVLRMLSPIAIVFSFLKSTILMPLKSFLNV